MKLAAFLALLGTAQGILTDDPAPPELDLEEMMDPGFVRIANPAFPSAVVRQVPVDRGPKIERAELAPYFAEGELLSARTAFDLGQWEKAQKLLEEAGTTAPVRYLRALVSLRAADYKTAAAELEALSEVYGPMRDRCLIQAAWAFEALKDFASAARIYEKVGERSRQFPDSRLGLARCRKNLKDLAGARAALTPFSDKPPPPWGRDVGAEMLLALADLQSGKKDDPAEKQLLLRVWSEHPISAQAAKAAARLGEANGATPEQLVTRADALIDAHRNQQGMTILEPLLDKLKLPDPVACRAHFAMGKGQRKQRLHPKAVATLAPVVKKCTDPDLRARALFILGFSRTIVEPLDAAPTYELLAHDYPGHAQADDALFAAADVRFKNGQQDQAMALLAQIVEQYPTGDFVAEALFKRFWILRRANDLEGAAASLQILLERTKTYDDSFETERALYWQARLRGAADDQAGALALYEQIAREHPTTYYGMTARERVAEVDPKRADALLAEPLAAADGVDPFPLYAGPVANDGNFATAVELLRLGFGDLVPSEILAIDRTALTVDSLRLMVHVLALAGDERAAHGLARLWLRRDLAGKITSETKLLWQIAYPNAFREQVVKAAELADKLDPDLLQALMREESALDPKALSWAGALGLTQLMPTTAAEVAAQLKLKRPSNADLFDPELNLRLGGKYLAGLIAQFKGTKQYAIASYNAGAGSVNRWRKEHPEDVLDEWVEDVPLTETRNYVKRVLRSYNTYRLLYPVATTPTPAPKTGARR